MLKIACQTCILTIESEQVSEKKKISFLGFNRWDFLILGRSANPIADSAVIFDRYYARILKKKMFVYLH